MNNEELNIFIKQEFVKCASDPTYFLKKYCSISHPLKGKLPFKLFPFQEKTLEIIHSKDYTIVNKSRQLGISTLAAGYALWLMNFHSEKNILCIATKQETARNMVKKVKYMYNSLPSWLREDWEENNKLSFSLINGSNIKATSAASDAGRSEAISFLIIDEGAFISNVEEIWTSSQQTLSTGGKCLVVSTPYGTGNWFHKTFIDAEEGNNPFTAVKLPWWVHPERDETWRKAQDTLLGERLAAQECDADFKSSGDLYFQHEWLDELEKHHIKEPLYKRGIDRNIWVWEDVDFGEEYLITADVSRGDSSDYSAFHVIKISTNEQVATFKGLLSPREFGLLLYGIGTEYNEALIAIDNANIGWASVEVLLEKGYPNLYHSPRTDKFTAEEYLKEYENEHNMVPGFTISTKTRPLVLNKLREYVGDKAIGIRCKRTLNEMKVFIWKYGRPEAQSGYNDDLIISLGMVAYLRETSLRFKQNSLELTKKALQYMQSRKVQNKGAYSGNSNIGIINPYSIINSRGGSEDISWLVK